MSQADAINSSAAEVPDWWQSVIDISGPPLHEEPDKIQHIPLTLLENTGEEDYVKYYHPRMISIGPIHHGYVQPMDDFKRKAVRELAERVKGEISIGQVCASVEEKLLSARNCYSCDIIKSFQEDREWCKMMFLDSCFVVAFICDQNQIFPNRSLLNMKNDNSNLVRIDLLLYENQLPFAVLDALADAFRCTFDFRCGLISMLVESCLYITFRGRWQEKIEQFNYLMGQWKEAGASAHLLQYYLDIFIFFYKKTDGNGNGNYDDDDLPLYDEGAPRTPSTIIELKKVGIKCSGTTSLSDISFYSYMLSGKLFLPQLTVDDRGKTLILNLAAYEFSCFPKYRSSGISAYLSSMGTFIHGEEDVKELQARGIVQLNHGDDDHTVVDFFRYIKAHHKPNPNVIRRAKQQISTYCKSKRLLPLRVAYAEFDAEFTQRYFSGPWRFLVFLAVVFTVSMTLIQTVLTAIQTFKKD